MFKPSDLLKLNKRFFDFHSKDYDEWFEMPFLFISLNPHSGEFISFLNVLSFNGRKYCLAANYFEYFDTKNSSDVL